MLLVGKFSFKWSLDESFVVDRGQCGLELGFISLNMHLKRHVEAV